MKEVLALLVNTFIIVFSTLAPAQREPTQAQKEVSGVKAQVTAETEEEPYVVSQSYWYNSYGERVDRYELSDGSWYELLEPAAENLDVSVYD